MSNCNSLKLSNLRNHSGDINKIKDGIAADRFSWRKNLHIHRNFTFSQNIFIYVCKNAIDFFFKLEQFAVTIIEACAINYDSHELKALYCWPDTVIMSALFTRAIFFFFFNFLNPLSQLFIVTNRNYVVINERMAFFTVQHLIEVCAPGCRKILMT